MSRNHSDLTGRVFGRQTVIRRHPEMKIPKWECLCECGNTCFRTISQLNSGAVKSCGCLRREKAFANSQKFIKHGFTIAGKEPPEYNIWESMKHRCDNPNTKSYHRYGGRGIKVCERWKNDFATFYKDMGPRPSPKHQLDRTDNDGDYSPDNCEWVTRKKNLNNKGDTVLLTAMGRTQGISLWAEELGIARDCIRGRLTRGWTVEQALELADNEGHQKFNDGELRLFTFDHMG